MAAITVIFLSQKMQTVDSTSYVPAKVEAQEEPRETNEISPDGLMTLIMKEEKIEGAVKYSFLVRDSETNTTSTIFTKSVFSGEKISIPANTFSPDKKYVFLKESDGIKTSYFVLSIDSSLGAQDPLDISSQFAAKYPDLIVTDMTGWGGINLIVINTNKADGGKGPSFWFDIPSKSFIQLSNRFD